MKYVSSFFFLSNMVILHHSYLFAIVILIAEVVSAIGHRFPVVQGSIERAKCQVGKIAPAAWRGAATRASNISLDWWNIDFSKGVSGGRCPNIRAAQYLHRGTYKSEVMGNGGCGSGGCGNTAKGGDRRWGFALKQGVLSIGREKRASRTKRTEGRVRHSATQRTRILPRIFRPRLRLYSFTFSGVSPEITSFQWDFLGTTTNETLFSKTPQMISKKISTWIWQKILCNIQNIYIKNTTKMIKST